ncbi:uncharacterized protein LOC119766511 [Culex quinquefasciatus]|uniref:uncharacterized protein LOC119766511 n=2 Tax=Culex quinquefasciatus TaxID=7176 RepID=UPI0018E2E932|nr:uncharacterized protein LOC119766511 [Culex quinquefasciatus]XP_039430439.1 uncharacterized protein LOC120413598 [Culex pipiens pallens]
MEPLRKRRDVLFTRVKWEQSNISALEKRKPPIGELQERLHKLTDLSDQFDKVQCELEEQTEGITEITSIFNHRMEFEDVYYQVKAGYIRMLDEQQPPRGSSDGTVVDAKDELRDAMKLLLEAQAQTQSTMSQLAGQTGMVARSRPIEEAHGAGAQVPLEVRLPPITLPMFSGDRKQWASFKDLFVSCIHNRNLNNSVKLHYLKSHLDGEAAAKVNSFRVTDGNYDEVWELLTEFYDKKKYTVAALVKEFVEQPPVAAPSLVGLRKIVSTSDEVVRQLKALGAQYEARDPWLIHLVLEKLDRETRSLWAQKLVDLEFPSFNEFVTFLERRCDALETCASYSKKAADTTTKKEQERKVDQRKTAPSTKAIQSFHANTQPTCPKCSEAHTIYQCASFRELPASVRRELVERAKLCFNCLKSTHGVKSCTSGSCRNCKQKHHTLLCTGDASSASNSGQPRDQPAAEKKQPPTKVDTTKQADSVASYVTDLRTSRSVNFMSLLPTAVVKVMGRNNVFHEVRAMVDSACMNSLISKQAFERLGLERRNASILVSGITDGKPSKTTGAVTLQIASRFDDRVVIVVDALILNNLVPDQPSQQFNVDTNALAEAPLADPSFNQRGKIDLLLGIEVFFSILEPGKLFDGRGAPIAQNSIFGYLVGGQFDTSHAAEGRAVLGLTTTMNLDQTLRKFWEVEEVPKAMQYTPDEQRAAEHFHSTLSRNEAGRYVVRLPFDSAKPQLGESATAAIRRFKAMERKFSLDSELQQNYKQFMTEYLALGHMEKVPPCEVAVTPEKSFYLPHHGVWKVDSKTTKLRVVFDASSKTASGVSLNDRLLVGPNVNEPLFNVFTRWRTYKFAFCADVEKMYRQVLVAREDADYQRIVWRESPEQPLEHYRLLTVTYGTASAAYQAMAALRQVAEDNKEQHPLAAERFPLNFYVDDLLSGADSIGDAKNLRNEITHVLESGGFVLRKWSSNDPQLLECGAEQDESIPFKLPQEEDAVKALGIKWTPQEDAFSFDLNFDIDSANTKRQLLSDSSKFFDPFGWIAPVTIRMKILFQHLWLYDLSWDDPLPAFILGEWIALKESLHHLRRIRIKRWIPHSGGKLQLHGFCDASEAAYAAVIYARTVAEDGTVEINLVVAKTRVAPIQQISLPRLELLAAELLVDLMVKVLESFTHLEVELVAWSDSQIVLHWLSSLPRKWKTFVANRTSKILQFLPRKHWLHVSSKNNPADCASRGITPLELLMHPLFYGPSWLKEIKDYWRIEPLGEVEEDELLEMRTTITCLFASAVPPPWCDHETLTFLLNRYSDLAHIRRILCWINRLRLNSLARRTNAPKLEGPLTPMEINDACLQLARAAQHDSFQTEIDCLVKNAPLPGNSKLKALFPFVDADGTLRVGGRLQNSNQPYDVRHPVIIPKEHRYTNLLLSEVHLRNLHAGPTLMIATLNQRYWIVGCQTVVRGYVANCTRCCRMKAKTATQLMGSLPSVRTNPARPFVHCGVDFAGPILVRTSNLRTAKTVKGYVAVFVCLATKAVHLEAVSDLSTSAFLAALKRMFARRGISSEIWSDHGTNFVGADRHIREHLQSPEFNRAVNQYLSDLKVKWTFITPSAPHMGGIWEAAVKSMKKHLRVVLGNTALTYEDLSTVLTQIEACLNSRPLCQLSASPDSYEALTPGHFIINQPLNLLPEPDVSHIKEGRLDKWQRIQRHVDEIWARWRDEYVATLQPRNKWQTVQQNLDPGQLVLIKNENTPPAAWELARIVAAHPDPYGVVRNVTVRRGEKEYQRPVHKLVPLPMD